MNLPEYLLVTKKHVRLLQDMLLTFEVCGHLINNNEGKGGNKYPPLSRDAKGAISSATLSLNSYTCK